jgi:hypothetical protein
MDTIIIPSRFEGPSGSAQGGWTARHLAAHLDGSHTYAFRSHIPLDTALTVDRERSALIGPAGELVIEASPWTPDIVETPPVSLDDATEARTRFSRFLNPNPVPDCFSCGSRPDSMGVRASPLDDGRFATDWTVPDWAEDPLSASAALWAALDCTAAFYVCFSTENRPAFTVQYAVAEHRPVRAGETLAIVGWSGDHVPTWDGRKRGAASVAFDASGTRVAAARSFWVAAP